MRWLRHVLRNKSIINDIILTWTSRGKRLIGKSQRERESEKELHIERL